MISSLLVRASLLALSFSTIASATSSSNGLTNSTICSPVHLILARGSTEPYSGSLATVADLVTEHNPGTTYEDIIYPATDETTTNSYHLGKIAARAQITSYIRKCPQAKTVLLSYSQGAMVVADVLAGGGGNEILGNVTSPLPLEIGNKITAIVFYGDPRHAPYQFYNQGSPATFNVTGKYPRMDNQLRYLSEHYGSRIQDYCNPGDPVCASGDNLTAHMSYVSLWSKATATWVQSMLDKDGQC